MAHRELLLNTPEQGPNPPGTTFNLVRLPRTEYSKTRGVVLFAVGRLNLGNFESFRQGSITIDGATWTTIFGELDVKNREDDIFDELELQGEIGNGTLQDET